MKINVFGMGYVGCVSAVCLANIGHDILGVDIDKLKIEILNDGKSPIVENGLDNEIKKTIDSGMLKVTDNSISKIRQADVSMVCVGTPSNDNGSLNIEPILRVSEQIGHYLRVINSHHVIVIRSTILPGTSKELIIPTIEEISGKKAGVDFGYCVNPEFMREGTSIHDFYNPPFTIIGELDKKCGDVVSEIYKNVNANLRRTSINVAEMVKYTCNCFHALKIVFANEIGQICKKTGIDSQEVMNIFCEDSKLNLSKYYLNPGFAFGGSCLPKDLKAILHKAKEQDVEIPVLSSILHSNNKQIESAFQLIKKTGRKKVGILGLSFKPGTDDLRDSPMVELVEKLIGKGFNIRIYDKEVSLAKIFGSNKRYIEKTIPHVSSLMKEEAMDVIKDSEVIVFGSKGEEFIELLKFIKDNQVIIDLVRVIKNPTLKCKKYEGICW